MPTETPLQRLASKLLREPVMPWIERRREDGKSWRSIADDLREVTHGEIDIPHQTVAYWTQGRPQHQPIADAS